jgi:hypothetical protein
MIKSSADGWVYMKILGIIQMLDIKFIRRMIEESNEHKEYSNKQKN